MVLAVGNGFKKELPFSKINPDIQLVFYE